MNGQWVGMRQTPNHPPTRCAGRYASKDLRNWTLEHFVYPDAADSTGPRYFDEIHGMSSIYVDGMVLGYLSWFTGDDTHVSTHDRGLIGTSIGKGTMEVWIATSRDGGKTWNRIIIREAWIPHGADQDSYNRCVLPPAAPLRVGDEDWFYCCVFNGDHLSIRRYYRDKIPAHWGLCMCRSTIGTSASLRETGHGS